LLQDQGRGWDHLGVLLSIVYRLVRCLFGLLAVLDRSDLSKAAELLVLRRQLRGRLHWDHADRLWLAALSRLASRRRWPQVFPVTLWDSKTRPLLLTMRFTRLARIRW
jgi:putative transposase